MPESGLLANIASVKYRHSIVMGQFLSLKDMLKLLISYCSKNSQKNTSWCVNMLNETLILCFAIIFQANPPKLGLENSTLKRRFLTCCYNMSFFTFTQDCTKLQKQQWEALKRHSISDSFHYDANNSLILLSNLSQQQRKIQISDIAPDDQIKPLARFIYAVLLAPKQTDSIVVSLSPLLEMLADQNTFLDALDTLTILLKKLDITDIEAQYHEVVEIVLDKLRTIKHVIETPVVYLLKIIALKFKTTEHQLWFIKHLIGMLKDSKKTFCTSVLITLGSWIPTLNEMAVQLIIVQVSALFEGKNIKVFCDILEDLNSSLYKTRLAPLLIAQLKQNKVKHITNCFLLRLNHADPTVVQYPATKNTIVALASQLDTASLLEWIVEVFKDFERNELHYVTALSMTIELVQVVEKNDLLERITDLLLTHIEMSQPWVVNKADPSQVCQLIERFEPTDAKKYTDRILALIEKHPSSKGVASFSVRYMILILISKFEMEDCLLWIKRLAITIHPGDFMAIHDIDCFWKRWIITVKSTDIQRLIEHIFAMLNDTRPMVDYCGLCMLKQVIEKLEIVPKEIWQWVPILLKKLSEQNNWSSHVVLDIFLALINQLEAVELEQCLLLIFDHAEAKYQENNPLFRVIDAIILRRPHLSAIENKQVSAFSLKQCEFKEARFDDQIFRYLAKWGPKLDATLYPSLAYDLLKALEDSVPNDILPGVLYAINVWMPTFSHIEIKRLDAILLLIMNDSPYIYTADFCEQIFSLFHRMLELNNSEIPLYDRITFLLSLLRGRPTVRLVLKLHPTLFLLISKLEANDSKLLMDSVLEQLNAPELSQREFAVLKTMGIFPFIGQEITPWITALIKLLKDVHPINLNTLLDVISLFTPSMREQDAIWVVSELASYFNHTNKSLQRLSFDAIHFIISYHPKYDYQLNNMSDSLEKFFITLMLDMAKIADKEISNTSVLTATI